MKHTITITLCLFSVIQILCAAPATEPAARWSFETAPPAAECPSPSSTLAEGVHGNGLLLSGKHQIQAKMPAITGEWKAVSFSAWVKPEDFDRYNEIFRQECPERLLFAFQKHGTILSLGLNIGGYTECDAKINPDELLDGAWHHCAATFDGVTMKVYLNGRLIGSEPRHGVVRFNPAAPAFIGSLGGRSEFFQGGLDEVTIFTTALSAEQVKAEWQRGADVLAKRGAACGGVPGLRTTLLTYHEQEWYGSTFWAGSEWTRVGKDWQHPDTETPSVRRFTAPRDGRVTISGRVFKLHLSGDGIRASIRHNNQEVWKTEIAGEDDKGIEPKFTLDVKKGDALRFIVDKRGNIGCDTTGWDPIIVYADGERFQASASFTAKKQGAGGWFYEALGQAGSTAMKQARKKPARASSPLIGPESFPEPATAALPTAAAEQHTPQLSAGSWVFPVSSALRRQPPLLKMGR